MNQLMRNDIFFFLNSPSNLPIFTCLAFSYQTLYNLRVSVPLTYRFNVSALMLDFIHN